MAQLMLINPARRPKKRRSGKATPAQLRALAKARAARRRTHRAPALAANPRRRRTLRALGTHHRRSHRRASRNPSVRGMGGIMGELTTGAFGAVGAVGVNWLFNFIPLPANLKTGMAGTAAKLALAAVFGMAARPVARGAAGKMAVGAMTVTMYEALQNMLPVSMGGSALPAAGGTAGLGYMSPGMVAGGSVLPNMSVPAGMGEYVSGYGGMGEYVY